MSLYVRIFFSFYGSLVGRLYFHLFTFLVHVSLEYSLFLFSSAVDLHLYIPKAAPEVRECFVTHSSELFCYGNDLFALHSENGGSVCLFSLPELYILGYGPGPLWLRKLILSLHGVNLS